MDSPLKIPITLIDLPDEFVYFFFFGKYFFSTDATTT